MKNELLKIDKIDGYFGFATRNHIGSIGVNGGRICDFLVYVDNSLIGTFRADGIIFSTPTGSPST